MLFMNLNNVSYCLDGKLEIIKSVNVYNFSRKKFSRKILGLKYQEVDFVTK